MRLDSLSYGFQMLNRDLGRDQQQSHESLYAHEHFQHSSPRLQSYPTAMRQGSGVVKSSLRADDGMRGYW